MRIEMASSLKFVGVAFFAAVLCLGMASAASASSITFDFSTAGSNVALGTSQAYTVSGVTITAYGYKIDTPNTLSQLFSKTGGTNETGLGLVHDSSCSTCDEIDNGHFVQLDLQDLFTQGYTLTLVVVQSSQSGEGFKIFGSTTQGILGTNLLASGSGGVGSCNGNAACTVTVTDPGTYRYIGLTATSGDVLLSTLTATAPSSPTPEPGTLFMMMSGLGGLWYFRRRK
jgi:hypothetical protein